MPPQARVVAVVNHAGGVGKTTTTLNLGWALAERGRRVLLCDLDPQADLSERLGLDAVFPTLANVLRGNGGEPAKVGRRWETGAGVDILPADFEDMGGLELDLGGVRDRERQLAHALAPFAADYDYILVDCPPNLSVLTVNAFYAADGVIIPVQAQAKAYRAVGKILTILDRVRGYRGGAPALWGFLLTMTEARRSAREVEAQLRAAYPTAVFTATIPRRDAATADSQWQKPIGLYAPTNGSAVAYAALAEEVIARVE